MTVKIRDSDPLRERDAGNQGGLLKASYTDSITNIYPKFQGRTAVQKPPEIYGEKLNCVASGKGPCVLMLKLLLKPTGTGSKKSASALNCGIWLTPL